MNNADVWAETMSRPTDCRRILSFSFGKVCAPIADDTLSALDDDAVDLATWRRRAPPKFEQLSSTKYGCDQLIDGFPAVSAYRRGQPETEADDI